MNTRNVREQGKKHTSTQRKTGRVTERRRERERDKLFYILYVNNAHTHTQTVWNRERCTQKAFITERDRQREREREGNREWKRDSW